MQFRKAGIEPGSSNIARNYSKLYTIAPFDW